MLEFIRQGNDGLLALADALEQNEKTGAVKAKPRHGTHHGADSPYGTEYFLHRQELYGTYRRIR